MKAKEAKSKLIHLIDDIWEECKDSADPIIEQLRFDKDKIVLVKNQRDDDLYYIQHGQVEIKRAQQGQMRSKPITLGAGDL